MSLDERSEKNIATLLPMAQAKAREFMALAVPLMEQRGAVVKIICGTRTYAEQDALFAQGRTKPGKIVTNASGGFSNHNFGIAWDIGIFKDEKYLGESPLYKECGVISRQVAGVEWGGDWKFLDEPHYQLKTGLTMAQMRERVSRNQSIV